MKVLVTDGDSRAALAITRSLGSKGHVIHVASASPTSISSCSKYCSEHSSYPDPNVDQEAFLEAIQSLLLSHDIDVLIPVTDSCVLPIVKHRSLFEPGCILPLPDWTAIDRAADKNYITNLANRLGVATPRSVTLSDSESMPGGELPFSFPVVIKPYRSRIRVGGFVRSTSVSYASDRIELDRELEELPAAAYPVLVQERIPGPGIGVFYCFNNGEPVATFAHRRLREKPPSGGVSVLRESVAPHPGAAEFGLRLLRELKWHGVAMVEFKLDERDNTPKLMEINGRFWGSLQLAIDSGVDFPDILLRIADGDDVPRCVNYKLGVRSRWLWGEVDVFLIYLLKSGDSLSLPNGHNSRFRSLLQVLNPYVRGQKLEVLRLSDIRPWLHESRRWFQN